MVESDPPVASQLLALVYDELRRLAAQKLAQEKAGQTLQPTALVHEAYLRLAGNDNEGRHWDGRGHFFAAAAEAMRRILVDNARRKAALKHGGGGARHELDQEGPPAAFVSFEERLVLTEDLLALDEALGELAAKYPRKAELVKLRYFAGRTIEEAAEDLGISAATAKRDWTFARAWLHQQITSDSPVPPDKPA